MPPSAPPRSNTQKSRASRTSSKKPHPQSAPVLFRLPYIDLKSLLSSPAEVTQKIEVPEIETTPETETAPQTAPSDREYVHRDSLVDAEIPAEELAAAQPLVVTTAAQGQSDVDQATEYVPASYEKRSWWEHWSSGVLLILLIIALVAASIMALNDQEDVDPNVLAEKEREEFSFDELIPAEVVVPDASVAEQLQLNASESAIEPMPPVATRASQPATAENSIPAPPLVASQAVASQAVVTTSQEPTAVPPQQIPAEDAAPAGSLMVNLPESPIASVPTPESTKAVESVGTAAVVPSLDAPIDSPPPPQLSEIGNEGATPQQVTNAPISQPSIASSSSESQEQIRLFPELPQMPAVDIAANQGPPPQSGMNATRQTGATFGRQHLQQQPPPQTSGTAFKTVSHAQEAQPNSRPEVAVTGNQAVPTPAGVANGSRLTESNTPRLDTDALIRVWQDFRQINQQETDPGNRYITNTETGQAPQGNTP